MTNALRFTSQYKTGSLYMGVLLGDSPLDQKLLQSVAFLDRASDDRPEEFTLEDAWNTERGILLLLGTAVQDPSALPAQINRLQLGDDVRILWIADPNRPFNSWVKAAFPFRDTGETRVLSETVDLDLTGETDGYVLRFGEDTEFAVDPDAGQLLCSETGDLTGFGRDGQVLPMSNGGLTIDLSLADGFLFDFQMQIPGGEALVSWLNWFQLGLWFGHYSGTGQRRAQCYPIFDSHPLHDGLDCHARIMPSRLTDPDRSYIRGTPTGGAHTSFVSFFLTILGRSVLLELQDDAFGMVFNATTDRAWGMSPQGRFRMIVSDQTMMGQTGQRGDLPDKDVQLACGSAGTEGVLLNPDVRDDLFVDFVPGQPAFAPGGDTGGPTLTDKMTSSWLRLSSPSKTLPYLAQPDGQGALYAAQGDTGESPVALLPYLPLPSAIIPAGQEAPIFPMVPLAGVAKNRQEAAIALENIAIAPQRKTELTDLPVMELATVEPMRLLPETVEFDEEDRFTAVTPRGLEAEFVRLDTGEERWDKVQVARLLGYLPGNSGQLRLGGTGEDKPGIIDPLKSALLTNQQFVVISDPAAIQPFFNGKDARITLKDWEFLLDPDTWSDHETIMIIKNAATSMQDLIDDTGAWTAAGTFNKNVASTARKLQKIAEDARASLAFAQARRSAALNDSQDPGVFDMEFFVNTVLDSPDWNGFIFLSAKLGAFPDDLAGMRAGLKPDGLYAHHLGVTQTPFTTLEEMQSQSSSMFGLIRYENLHKPSGNGVSYAFQVRELGVLFENSDLRDFRTVVDLSIGQMFGQKTRLENGEAPVSQMEGVRHRRGDGDAYTFVAVQPIRLLLGAGPLQAVHLEQGEFVTNSVDPSPTGVTRTTFSFAGSLNFRVIQTGEDEFDVFSFDALAFSDLAVRMDFDNDNPRKPRYAFSIEDLQLVEALSKARDRSLFQGFPITIGRLVENSGKPDSLGNMTVRPPDPPKALPKSWYGVMLTLDMGTLSDVAGAAGIEAQMLLAWGPSANQYYIGLNISGAGLSGSGNDLSLLGVLKLSTYALSLRQNEGAWVLLMHGMTLGVFGKSLPPNASFEFYVFGNQDQSGSSNSLGWYGAFLMDDDKKADDTTIELTADTPAPLPILTNPARLRFRGAS